MKLALILLVACGSASLPPPSHRSTETPGKRLAVAVVFNGWELFAGNDTLPEIEKDDPSRYEGVLPTIDAETTKLRSIGADGSLAALIVYDDRAQVIHPLAPIRDIGPGWFGTQKTYFGKFGIELVSGIELALKTLADAPPDYERVLLVIGDGCDTNIEAAKSRLAKLALAKGNIAFHEIRIATKLSGECSVLAPAATLDGTALAPGFDKFVATFR